MLYKKFGGDNFAAQMVGEAKLRQLKQVDTPYLSASGPGFVARKRGGTNEVWLEEVAENERTPGWQIVTTLRNSDEERVGVRTDAKIRKVGEPSNWGPEIYIGRGLLMMFIVPPQLRLFKHSYAIEGEISGTITEHRVWAYAQKPGYLSVGRVKPWQKKPGPKRLLLPVMRGLEKFIGYGTAHDYRSDEFPGFGRSDWGALRETVGIQYPTGFAGFYVSDGVERCSIVALNSKVVGTGGFGIPTAHATLDIVSFTSDFTLDAIQTREVPLPVGIGGTGQNLCASNPITISPGVVCIISCEVFEPRRWYDGKMQGDFYLSIYDIGKSEWAISAKKIVPEVANAARDYPYPEHVVRGRNASGRIVSVSYGDTTKRLQYTSLYKNQDTLGYDYVAGVESGTGQPCCNSDSVLFAFVRFRGERVTSGNLVTRSTDIFVMKIDRQGVAKTTRLFFPHVHDARSGLNANEYTGMYSSGALPQYLNMLCIGKGKFFLQINRYPEDSRIVDSEFPTPPAEFFNYIKFLISEDDGDTWQEVELSGIPFKFSSGPSTAELGKPSIIKPLSAAAYQAGEYAEIVIPFFLGAGEGTAYYASRDGGRSWEMERHLSGLSEFESDDGFNGGVYRKNFSNTAPSLRVGSGFGQSNIYRDYYVRQSDLPTSEEIHILETPESISGRKLQRVFIGNDPAPMDLVRPWIYDSAYEKPKEP